jgi:thiol-disulfide isomerase/thioredoxin
MSSFNIELPGYRPMQGGSIRLSHVNHYNMPRVIPIENEYELDRHTMTAGRNRNLVVICFWAPWCEACQTVLPEFEKLAEKYVDVICMRVNVDYMFRLFDNQVGHNFIRQEKLNNVPTFLFYRGGKRLGTVVGNDMKEVENKIKWLMQDWMFTEYQLPFTF